MNLESADLHLLMVFNALYETGSVSRAAEKLALSQPATSHVLRKLRLRFEDPLFIRTRSGMEPTPLAKEIAEPVQSALELIRSTLQTRRVFDPLSSTQTFTLALTDIGEIYFLPRLMAALGEAAPGVGLTTVRDNSVELREDLERGKIDLAIGLHPQLRAGFFQRRLFTQGYVCLYRQHHPFEGQSLTLEQYQQAHHVVAIAHGTGHYAIDQHIAAQGIHRDVRLSVPHYVALSHILHETDLIATVPERYANECASLFKLNIVPCPVPLPQTDICMFWHARLHHDPANQWLRRQVAHIYADRPALPQA